MTKGLYLLVEGGDDERLLEYIYEDHLPQEYSWFKIYQYAQRKPKDVCNFIRALPALNADYLFFADLDRHPCITSKKEQLASQYSDLDGSYVQVVALEIESWYLAGLDQESAKSLGISKPPKRTDTLDKEQFNSLMPKKFDSRIGFMQEILKYFSIQYAETKNTSFAYFVRRRLQTDDQNSE